MADTEVGFTTDSSGQNFCISVWDLSSGMPIKSYKGGNCSSHALSLMGNQYIMAGQFNKPIIHVWNIAKEQMHMKLICPGKVSAIICSPDGHYCVVSCGESIYIWQVATGNLLVILSRHFQRVSCLKFTDSGTHFLSGGDDNLVMTWDMAQVLSQTSNPHQQDQTVTPWYTWSDHALPVTDIYCGCGGLMAHVFTSSLDQTCKLYSLGSGQLLCSFVFDCGITAITTDPSEYNLFAGGTNGSIYQIHLYNPALKEENHIEKENPLIFKGHNKQVNSLAVSMDGCLLLSGSSDCTARTWHVSSRQCTRTVSHKGPVTNAQIHLRPAHINEPLPKNLWPVIQPFKRHLQSSGKANTENSATGVPIILSQRLNEISNIDDNVTDLIDKVIDEHGMASDPSTSHSTPDPVTREDLIQEVSKLQKVNQELYQFAVDKLISQVEQNIDTSRS